MQDAPLLPSQRLAQYMLVLAGLWALGDGALQFYLGQPDATPRLDNIHRSMGGFSMGLGILALWAAYDIRRQNGMIYMVCLALLLGTAGRLHSINVVGLPEPWLLWFLYLLPELLIPLVIVVCQLVTNRRGGALAR